MASILGEWWVVNHGVNKWAKMQTTITDTWGDWMAPVMIKTGTCEVDGETRDCGIIMFAIHENAIQPPTPVQTFSNVKTGGDMDNPNPETLYTWEIARLPDQSYQYGEFKFWGVATGNDSKGFYGDYYSYNSWDDMYTAIDNGDLRPIQPKVYFDVYINGTDKPSIWVNWTAAEDLSPVTLSPRVWQGVQYTFATAPEYITDQQTGLVDVNPDAWFTASAGSYSYSGSFETTYLTIQTDFERFLNPVSKLNEWGFDGSPEYIKLYLRMVNTSPAGGTDGIGDLATVTITQGGQGSYILVSGSSDHPGFDTIVRFHTGEPDYVMPDDPDTYPGNTNIDDDGPGRYDPNDIPDPADFTDPAGFDGNAVLTKTYMVSAATLENIGQKLWTQSYFDVLKIQSNPIENIIAVKHYPFAKSGTAANIVVGDVDFGIQGDEVPRIYVEEIGSYKWNGKFKSFLDLSPYTSVKINLPYCGIFSLDPADIYGSTLSVTYYIDLVTGQCMAKLSLDAKTLEGGRKVAIPYMTVYGQIGVDIPLTSSDRVQTELRTASAAVTAMAGSAGQIIAGNVGGGVVSGLSDALSIAGSDYTSQRTSAQSPACTSYACQDVFLIIEAPTADVVEATEADKQGYTHLHGKPCHKYKTLGSFPAGKFVQIEKRTDINAAMTSEENRMLEELLTSGVYI